MLVHSESGILFNLMSPQDIFENFGKSHHCKTFLKTLESPNWKWWVQNSASCKDLWFIVGQHNISKYNDWFHQGVTVYFCIYNNVIFLNLQTYFCSRLILWYGTQSYFLSCAQITLILANYCYFSGCSHYNVGIVLAASHANCGMWYISRIDPIWCNNQYCNNWTDGPGCGCTTNDDCRIHHDRVFTG